MDEQEIKEAEEVKVEVPAVEETPIEADAEAVDVNKIVE